MATSSSPENQGKPTLASMYFEHIIDLGLKRRGQRVAIQKKILFHRVGEGAWLLDLSAPDPGVTRTVPTTPADLVLHLDINDAELMEFMNGTLAWGPALDSGRVRVLGDRSLLRRLATLFATPEKLARRSEETDPLKPKGMGVGLRTLSPPTKTITHRGV